MKMARLISYDYIRKKALADPDSGEAIVYLQDIADAPTVYALEVVRCRDCIHYFSGACLKIYSDGSVSQYAWQERNEDDFCSYGERKDGDGNG